MLNKIYNSFGFLEYENFNFQYKIIAFDVLPFTRDDGNKIFKKPMFDLISFDWKSKLLNKHTEFLFRIQRVIEYNVVVDFLQRNSTWPDDCMFCACIHPLQSSEDRILKI